MDMEAGKTLTNEEVIRELLDLLKKNAMKEQANDVFEICSYVDGLEKKIDSMTEELTNMQNQIKEMQEDTLVNNAKKGLTNKGLRVLLARLPLPPCCGKERFLNSRRQRAGPRVFLIKPGFSLCPSGE